MHPLFADHVRVLRLINHLRECGAFQDIATRGGTRKHRRLDDIELMPKVTDSFNGGFPLAEVVFTRSDGGELTGMTVSSVRTRGVRFERIE